MNALNLISSRVIGQTPPATRPRSRSQGELLQAKLSEELLRGRSFSEDKLARLSDHDARVSRDSMAEPMSDDQQTPASDAEDEKQPLLDGLNAKSAVEPQSGLRYWIKRLADALTALLSTIGMPLIYIAKTFQNEDGHYMPFIASWRIKRRRTQPVPSASARDARNDDLFTEKATKHRVDLPRSYSSESLSSATSESENDHGTSKRGTRGKAIEAGEEPKRRQSTRIKLLHNDEAVQKRKQKSALSAQPMNADTTPLTVDSIKSPTSASSSLRATRYPHAPQPPRPLIPRRQPSYSNLIPRSPSRYPASSSQQKTLVLDLDETLIHSMAKGGRMSSGHMVEVKLNVPVSISPTQTGHQPPTIIGPQHPILYYVHKRPHCDEFLRKVNKWFKLVVFTASVQEYADPVINWLEQERKYFQGRYYRQHCTFRNGSYIKDLSSIEPDLSKVIILDNSPISYIFHEDNAIPIEGWINDPTDNDLLHLIPMLEALQYVNDVRALLALRRGEAEAA